MPRASAAAAAETARAVLAAATRQFADRGFSDVSLDDVAEVTLVEQKDTFVSHAAALRAAVDRVSTAASRSDARPVAPRSSAIQPSSSRCRIAAGAPPSRIRSARSSTDWATSSSPRCTCGIKAVDCS
ncbi:hypothetical protein, partial [uncultured Bradyrhizobium sp.]|uniref:hypothetical protein n=1 Tax=uncultured Bradyrhizobium sp. TaxID=199684 RepID=UPI002610F4C6